MGAFGFKYSFCKYNFLLMNFYLSLLMLLISFSLHAQTTYEIMKAADFFNINKLERGEWKKTLTEYDIEGSPYLEDNFVEGAVYMTSKVKFEGLPLRYNIFNDRVEFQADDGSLQVLSVPEVIDKVEFGETTLEYSVYLQLKKIKRGFFIVLEKGNATLYLRPRVIFEDAQKAGAYTEAKPPKFIRRPDEYYIRVDKEPAGLISKKRDIEELFSNHGKEAEEFIRKNKIKINRVDDLIKLVQYYNSL